MVADAYKLQQEFINLSVTFDRLFLGKLPTRDSWQKYKGISSPPSFYQQQIQTSFNLTPT